MKLFGNRVKNGTKTTAETLAVSIHPSIKIEVTENELKSKIIKNMKTLLEKMKDDPQFDLDQLLAGSDKQLDLPFVPEEDEEDPDLELEELDGPEVTEEQIPEGEYSGYSISIKELVE